MVVKSTARTSGLIIKIVFKIVFLCLFGLSLLLGLYLTNIVRNLPDTQNYSLQYIEKWTVIDESGKSFETGRTYDDERAYTEDFITVSHLPDKLWNDSMLCFLNRSNVKVYINGELRKEFDRYKDTGIPGGSMKEFYITVPLGLSDAGAEIKIYRQKTDWNPFVVPETFVSSSEGFFDYLYDKYGISFGMSAVLFIASLLVTVIGIAMLIWKRQNINMLYASLGVLDVACWLISVSQLTPYVTRIFFVDGIMGFMFCMMMPFALLIYLNSLQKGRYRKLYAFLFILSLVNMIFWTIMHFTGIQSFQSSLIYIDSVLAIVAVIAMATLFIDAKKGYVREYPYAFLGFLIFIVMSIAEIILLIFFQLNSNEIPMLIGLMSLLVLVFIQQVDDLRKVRDKLELEVKNNAVEKEQMLIHIVQTLAGTIDAKDTYTNGHSSRVADYSREIAERFGYEESQLNDINMMGLLHDIGKIGIPDAVINKPARLTDEEYALIKKHPVMGAKILDNIKEKTDLSMGARWHHEKYGGGGYPDGIAGEEIPEQARIIAVANAYDAMTSYRSYRDPMPQETLIFIDDTLGIICFLSLKSLLSQVYTGKIFLHRAVSPV